MKVVPNLGLIPPDQEYSRNKSNNSRRRIFKATAETRRSNEPLYLAGQAAYRKDKPRKANNPADDYPQDDTDAVGLRPMLQVLDQSEICLGFWCMPLVAANWFSA